MLELCHVSAGYGAAVVLREISLSVPPGQVLAVVGPNGGGKSTLLKTAAGLLSRQGGEILLDGVPLESMPPKQIARKVAYLPQQRPVPDISAGRMALHGRFPYLEYPRRYSKEDRSIVAAALAEMDVLPLADRPMKELSGGERQRVYLAMALAQQTEIILLDEPTANLDIAHQLEVMALAGRLAGRGKAVAMVLHDLPLAFQEADRVAVLAQGTLVRMGTPNQVFEAGTIPAVFGVSFSRIRTTAGGWQYACGRMEPAPDPSGGGVAEV